LLNGYNILENISSISNTVSVTSNNAQKRANDAQKRSLHRKSKNEFVLIALLYVIHVVTEFLHESTFT
jgi:hypothetical protein